MYGCSYKLPFVYRKSIVGETERNIELVTDGSSAVFYNCDIMCGHQCQFLELTPMVSVWSSLPGKRSIVNNYTKMVGITEILIVEECITIFLTLAEAIKCIPVAFAVQVMWKCCLCLHRLITLLILVIWLCPKEVHIKTAAYVQVFWSFFFNI